MTKEQYEQWCDFSMRMARGCYADHRRPDGEWVTEQVEWFLSRYDHGDHGGIVDWDSGSISVCSDVSIFAWEQMPGFSWRLDEGDIGQDELDRRVDLAQDQWMEQFFGPVNCCVRAGLDMATEIGGGVVGFCVGQLRAMYPGGIPQWVRRHYSKDLDALPDDMEIWL